MIMTPKAEETACLLRLVCLKLALGSDCTIPGQIVMTGLGMCGICLAVRIGGLGKPRVLPAGEFWPCDRHTQGLHL